MGRKRRGLLDVFQFMRRAISHRDELRALVAHRAPEAAAQSA
jgi:hypothetical protein